MRNSVTFCLTLLYLCFTPILLVQASSSKQAAPTWCAHPGDSLKKIIQQWAQHNQWSVQWHFEYDYPITVTTCFTGTFNQVMQQVAQAYHNAEYPFYLDLYPQQQLVVVSY